MQSRAEGNTANQPHSKQSLDDDFEASIPPENIFNCLFRSISPLYTRFVEVKEVHVNNCRED